MGTYQLFLLHSAPAHWSLGSNSTVPCQAQYGGSVASGMQCDGSIQRNGHISAVSSAQRTCTSVTGGQTVNYLAKHSMVAVEDQPHSLHLSIINIFPPVFMTKKWSEWTIHEHQGSHQKSWLQWQCWKMVSWNASKGRVLLWRKCCVNRCKFTYFCVINQFQELSEGICVWRTLIRWNGNFSIFSHF
jgi:hypothetical protein